MLNEDRKIIASLEENVADAQAELENIQEQANYAFYREVTIAKADDKKKADKIRDELAQAQRKLDEATGALLAARKVAEQNAQEQAATVSETAWKDAEKAARKLDKTGVELEAIIENLYLKYEEVLYLNKELVETATGHGIRLHHSALATGNIEGALRLTLLKAGFKWAAQWDRELSQIVTVGETVKRGITSILDKNPQKQANKDVTA